MLQVNNEKILLPKKLLRKKTFDPKNVTKKGKVSLKLDKIMVVM